MTGMGRMLVLVSLLSAAQSAFAVRVELSGTKNQAVLSTELIPSRSSQVESVEINLSVPALDIDADGSGFDALTVEQLVPSLQPGNPELLHTGALLAVPNGFEPVLEVIHVDEKVLDNVNVRPFQEKWRCGGPKGSFAFNSALYRSEGIFPAQVASLEEVGKLAGIRLVRVALNPIRMNMAAKQLVVAHSLKLQVQFKANGRAFQRSTLSPTLLQTLVASTVNGKSLSRSFLRSTERAERMVILSADQFKDTMNTYADWKRSQGMQDDVVTLTQAGGNKEALQKHIKLAYDQASVKPTYLLLVGNKESLPAFKESTGSGSAASDYRMALLAGDDQIPDVFYGRFLADNAEELATQIERTIAYEKSSKDQPWQRKAMTIASDEGSDPSDEEYALQVQEALKSGGYTDFDSFFQGEKTAKASNILGALKDGRSWIAYFGHGSGTSWGSVNDTFSVSTISQVENTGRLPVLIDVACQNASWMNISKCFGKTWMTEKKETGPVGTVAYYGGSVNISWHPPAVMSVGIAKRQSENSVRTIGSSVMAGQLYLIEKMGTGNQVIDNLKWYNLFGDPSLEVKN